MKKELSPAVIVGIFAVVAVIVIMWGYRATRPAPYKMSPGGGPRDVSGAATGSVASPSSGGAISPSSGGMPAGAPSQGGGPSSGGMMSGRPSSGGTSSGGMVRSGGSPSSAGGPPPGFPATPQGGR